MTPCVRPCLGRFAAITLAAVITGCATAPAKRPLPGQPESPAAVNQPDVKPPNLQPSVTPPSNPMLVAAANEAKIRGERFKTLSRETFALPVGDDGYYLDVLYAQLRKALGTTTSVTREASGIRILLPPAIAFDVASARLSPDVLTKLDAILKPLGDYAALLISVHGHTDATGPVEVNQRLSAQRALTVAGRLQTLGIGSARIMAIGHGSAMPRAANDTDQGRQQNRRVELLLEPIVATP